MLHLGGNVGDETDEYAALGVDRVVWVEGYRPYFERLQAVTGHLPNHTAH